MKTIRKQILDKFDIRMKEILISNGYQTDIGENVYFSKVSDRPVTMLPMINYRDVQDSIEDHTMGYFLRKLTIEIETVCRGISEEATIDELDQISGDIETAVGMDPGWSALAMNTLIRGPVWELKRGDTIIGAARFAIEIWYKTKRFNPYLQS